jgi:hypothetical protein
MTTPLKPAAWVETSLLRAATTFSMTSIRPDHQAITGTDEQIVVYLTHYADHECDELLHGGQRWRTGCGPALGRRPRRRARHAGA